MSLKESIMQASDLPTRAIEVPEWHCTVYVKQLSGTERIAWRAHWDAYRKQHALAEDSADVAHVMAVYLVHVLCNESGERIFADTEVACLLAKSFTVIERLFDQAREYNDIGGVEKQVKNS